MIPEPCKDCLVKVTCRRRVGLLYCDNLFLWSIDQTPFNAVSAIDEMFIDSVTIGLSKNVELTDEMREKIIMQQGEIAKIRKQQYDLYDQEQKRKSHEKV